MAWGNKGDHIRAVRKQRGGSGGADGDGERERGRAQGQDIVLKGMP